MAQDLPPVPQQVAVTDANGRLTPAWADWFKKAAARMGGNIGLSNKDLATRQIGTPLIQDGAITTAKIAANAVTAAKIANATITGTQVAASSIPFAKLVPSEWVTSLGTSGYAKIPSGLLLQWGRTVALNPSTLTTISFPATFPTGCLHVFLSLYASSAATGTGPYGTGNYTTTNFEIYNNNSGALTFNFLAVGY